MLLVSLEGLDNVEKNWKGGDKAKGNETWMEAGMERIRTTQPRVCLHGNPL